MTMMFRIVKNDDVVEALDPVRLRVGEWILFVGDTREWVITSVDWDGIRVAYQNFDCELAFIGSPPLPDPEPKYTKEQIVERFVR